ncbi:MAG: LysR family transcriptional regulator [Paracoccaceae bacterium]
MPRNLDLTALRAFVTVADVGGVTRAAATLNLTQSAVSMQIKRLEDSLGRPFFFRTARKLSLTPEGEQLLAYGRRMLDLNDELLGRLGSAAYSGELRLGVPHDVVYPAIPEILKRMAQAFPRLRINLTSSFTTLMKEALERGELDLVLTTEDEPGPSSELLASHPLVWIGAPGGSAWRNRPLRLGFEENCKFRAAALLALDAAGIDWEMGFFGRSNEAVQAMVAADLAVSARMKGFPAEGAEPISAQHGLPELGQMHVCLYDAGVQKGPMVDELKSQLRAAYSVPPARSQVTTTLPVDFRSRSIASA